MDKIIGGTMDYKEEIVELKTITVLLDDKLHRIQDILSRVNKRLDKVEEMLREREEVTV